MAKMKTSPKWMIEAEKYLGLAEVKGPKHNPVILGWLRKLKAWWAEDETPWCGTFVANCMNDVGLAPPKAWYRAMAWTGWGRAVVPQFGAVLVFKRPGGGHVGFYLGEDRTRFRVRGGNQNNQVSDTWIDKIRLVGCRWPSEVPVPNTGRVMLADNGQPSSTNEA